MEKQIMVSVAIPFYNQEKYVAETLESAIAQKTNFDFEIVCGDDGSVDKSPIILADIEKKYPGKIRVIYNKINLGLVLNINNIFDNCKGKYIALLGGDDLFSSEHKLQKQYDFLENNPDYGVVHSDTKILIESSNQKIYIINSVDEAWGRKVKAGFIFNDLILSNFISASTAFFKRDLYVKYCDYKTWNELGFKMEDYPFWLEISNRTKIGYLNESLSTFRFNEGTVSRSKDFQKRLDFENSMYQVRKYYIDKYGHSNVNQEIIDINYQKIRLRIAYFFKNKELGKKTYTYLINNQQYEKLHHDYYIYFFGSLNTINQFIAKCYFRLMEYKRWKWKMRPLETPRRVS
jgi:glycosyltransferase involved in cell wall biosynthesis